jgi:hypothetical protein
LEKSEICDKRARRDAPLMEVREIRRTRTAEGAARALLRWSRVRTAGTSVAWRTRLKELLREEWRLTREDFRGE